MSRHDPIPPADFSRLTLESLRERRHKVTREHLAGPGTEVDLAPWLDGLPDVLAVRELRGLARAIVDAREENRPVVAALGGAVVKVGLTPLLLSMIDGGHLTALVINGAAAIHDWEMAAIGETSEHVDSSLADGRFGTSRETGAAIARAARVAHDEGLGLGPALGRCMLEDGLPYNETSIVAGCARRGVPLTIHVSIGGDVVHVHPDIDGAALGAAAFTDFRRVVTLVGSLGDGGVWMNCGSAVQLPEVFVKALSAARNLGQDAREIVTADLDMQRHYRTTHNVLRRPGGPSFRLLGHHELNIPLLASAIRAEADRRRP